MVMPPPLLKGKREEQQKDGEEAVQFLLITDRPG
jgi:hypothetical protein